MKTIKSKMDEKLNCVDCVSKLMSCLPFKLVSSIRTKNANSNSVHSILENLGDEPQWISVRVGLELIQTFLTFVPEWSDMDEVVRDHLGDLVNSIEDAIETAGKDIADAAEKGDAELLDAAGHNLQEKSESLKPRIREAYDFLSKHAFQVTSTHLPITDHEVWSRFCSSLTDASRFLSTPTLLQIEDIVASLHAFGEVYLTRASDGEPFRSLGLHFEGVAIGLARLLFLWWADETDDHDKTVMLKNVMQGMSQPEESSGTVSAKNKKTTAIPAFSQIPSAHRATSSMSEDADTISTDKSQVQPEMQLPRIDNTGAASIPSTLQSVESDVTLGEIKDLSTIPGGNKMEPNPACVDNTLEKIMGEPTLYLEYTWFPVIDGLELIQTFLIFAPNWSDNDEVVGKHLGALVSSINDAFDTAGLDIGNAVRKGDAEGIDAVRSILVDKIEILKPRLREAYDFLSEYVFQITSPLPPPITDPKAWSLFCDLLVSNAMRFLKWSPTAPFVKQYPSIVHSIKCFGHAYLVYKQPRGLGILMEGTAICLARLIFLSWIEEANEKDGISIILDLLQRIKPSSKEILEMYMESLSTSPEDLNHLVGIILTPCQTSLQAMRDGMQTLIEYLLDPCSRKQPENVRELRSDVEKVVFDAASLAHNSDELEIFHLLQNMQLLQVEFALTNPITECKTISTRTFESIYAGLDSLQTFHIRPLGVYSEKLMLIFKLIEQVVRRAECLHLQVNQVRHSNPVGLKLFLDFRLLKIQAFLMEQMRCCPGLMVLLREKFVALNEGLELLYKYFSVLPADNEELILSYIKRLAKEEIPPYYLTLSDQVPKQIITKMSVFVSTLLRKVNLLTSEIQDAVLLLRTSSVATFPKTAHQGVGFVDIVLEKLSALVIHKANSIGYQLKHQIETVIKELGSLKSHLVLIEVGEKRNRGPTRDDIRRRVAREAYEAEFIIDWILLVGCDFSHMLWLSEVINEMKLLITELAKVDQMKKDLSQAHGTLPALKKMTKHGSAPQVGEAMIALEDQENAIIDRLIRGISQQKDVVTISGMPGIGKTTLASRVYENTRVKNHFRIRAWCCVSQEYQRTEVLLRILSDITECSTGKKVDKKNDEVDEKTDEELMNMLYKGLKGMKYLIVIDDVWSNQVWEELGIAFPDDKGSRILITTRNQDVGLQAQKNSSLHTIRSLTTDESWTLLQRKVFHGDGCPLELQGVGMKIAERCQGLPLSVVAIAGVLKTIERKADQWKHIEKDLNPLILEKSETQCMSILELSYNHLPDCLKQCFLYLAAFREDAEISVQRLIQLWIAEGFITKVHDDKSSLEDVAESYVKDLIGRSLLMAAKKGSQGRVKACKVHDMLHTLCLRKVAEEQFLQCINGYEKLFPSNKQLDYGVNSNLSPISVAYEQHRLSICSKRKHFIMLKPSGPSVRTLIFSATSDTYPRCPYSEISFVIDKFKILKILDIESINIGSSFPGGILVLYPLKYLAISGDIRSLPSTVANLWNLETFIVRGLVGGVVLPDTLWSMSRLRHLQVTTQAIFSLLQGRLESCSQLKNMVSLSCPVLSLGDSTEEMLKLFPKLRKLKCTLSEPTQQSKKIIRLPILDFLEELESLKILFSGFSNCELKRESFPMNLKKLSLENFRFTWDDFTAIGELPNLKILKLGYIAFDSSIWEMNDDEFQQLEYLKLDSLKIAEWNAESGHLPNLQQLVLQSCIKLEKVPSSFGEISTLETIELNWCSVSSEKSLVSIVEQQLDYGNNGFKTFINVLAADPIDDFRHPY